MLRVGEQLRICEIKGFPIIDGTASPTKVRAAARQTAVYVAVDSGHARRRGAQPGPREQRGDPRVCPRNFSIGPVVVLVDVDREVPGAAAAPPPHGRHVGGRPCPQRGRRGRARGAGREVGAAKPGSKADRAATGELVDRLPYRYVPECLSGCDLARHCRSCAVAVDDPARLGGDVAASLGGVGTVGSAIGLIEGAPPSADEVEVAEMLRAASRAIEDATGLSR